MKQKALRLLAFVLSLAAFLVIGSSVFPHNEEIFEQAELTELSGTVQLKRPGGFFITTSSGQEYKLVLGPIWYLERIGLELEDSDRVTVRGFEDERGIFFVTSVQKDSQTYEIVDPEQLDSYCHGPRAGMWGGMHHHKRFNYGPENDSWWPRRGPRD